VTRTKSHDKWDPNGPFISASIEESNVGVGFDALTKMQLWHQKGMLMKMRL
jgi:hypothetical protein